MDGLGPTRRWLRWPGRGRPCRLDEAVQQLPVLLLGQDLLVLELRVARIDDHIGFEIQNTLELAHRHIQEQSDARRQAFEEPDVGNRCGELDVAHTLTADLGLGDLDAALVTHDAAILHPLVLSAQALPVGHRAEDLGAEQAVTLGLERPVVDGLRLADLAVGPRPDLLGARQTQPNRVEIVEGFRFFEEASDFAQA